MMQEDGRIVGQSQLQPTSPYLSTNNHSLSNSNALTLMVMRSQIHFCPHALNLILSIFHIYHFLLLIIYAAFKKNG